jgi:queuosine precursor transporter
MSKTPDHTLASKAPRPAKDVLLPPRNPAFERRRQLLLLVLSGFFLTNALLAELIGGKLFQIPTGLSLLGKDNYPITMTCGVILWPVVFIMTDIVNEYFGRGGVRRLSIIGAGMIAYAFVALWITNQIPTAPHSPIKAEPFANVFMQSQFIIVGSIIAFLLAQLIDVTVFWIIRRRTGHRLLWLRATGSTVISQVIDTYLVGFIGLYLPFWLNRHMPETFANASGLEFRVFLEAQTAGYLFKLLVALAITPLLYLIHAIIDRYLGETQARAMIETAAAKEHASDAEVAV